VQLESGDKERVDVISTMPVLITCAIKQMTGIVNRLENVPESVTGITKIIGKQLSKMRNFVTED